MFRVRAVKSRLSHILSFYLQRHDIAFGKDAFKATYRLLQQADKKTANRQSEYFAMTEVEEMFKLFHMAVKTSSSTAPPPLPPASTAKRPKKMEQKEEAKDKKKQREEEDLKMKTSKRRPAPKKTWPA